MRGARVFYLRKRAMSYHDMIAIFFFVIFLGTTFALAAVFCLDAVIEIALLGAPMLYLLNGQKCVEAGTIINYLLNDDEKWIDVAWDCGYRERFLQRHWKAVRVYDLGPAGFRNQFVLCDECMEEVTGFSFQCLDSECSHDLSQIYDLCHKHYNNMVHSDNDHKFRVRFSYKPEDRDETRLPLRRESIRYKLLGLFPDSMVVQCGRGSSTEPIDVHCTIVNMADYCLAMVTAHSIFSACASVLSAMELESAHQITSKMSWTFSGKKTRHSLYLHFCSEGIIKKIVHDRGRQFKEVSYWNCCVQVEWDSKLGLGFTFEDAGMKGSVPVIVQKPADDGVDVYADHYPSIDESLMKYMECKSKNCVLSTGESFHLESLHCLGHTFETFCIADTQLAYIEDNEDCWSKCSKLDLAQLLRNKLRVLPRSLIGHPLKILSLSYNDFCDFPRDVLYFKKTLENLNMIKNYLTILPSSLGELTALTNLHLGNNGIIYLPDCFQGMAKLVVLNLHHNQLTSLPPSFSCLSNLKTLTLNNNCFRAFPENLLKLKKLWELKIHCNHIQFFKSEVEEFCRRIVCSRDPPHCSQFMNPLRVLVIGEDDAGKTSLVRALCEDDFIFSQSSKENKHAIGIDNYHYQFIKDGANCELSLWDFSGEKSFAMMNGMFLAKAALVWIVVDVDKFSCDNYKCYEEKIGVWLRKVLVHFEPGILPKIWIIGTHLEECPVSDRHRKRSKIEWLLFHKNKFRGVELRDKCEVLFLPQSSIRDKFIEEIKVENLHSRDEQWCFKEYSLNLRATEMVHKHKLPLVTLDELSSSIEVRKKSDFIDYLQGNGEILMLTFNDLDGQKTTKALLSARWFIYILKQVFRYDLKEVIDLFSKESDRCDPEEVGTIFNHLKKGEISENTLKLLWKPLGLDGSTDILIRILCDYKLFYFDPNRRVYVIPWLLRDGHSVTLFDHLPSGAISITFVFTFHYIDPCFFEEILLICPRQNFERNTWSEFRSKCTGYELFVKFEQNLMMHKGKYYDRIVFDIRSEYGDTYPMLWPKVKNEIIDRVNDRLLRNNSQYKDKHFPSYVICPRCRFCNEEEPQNFQWNELSTKRKANMVCAICERHGRKSEISLGDVFPGHIVLEKHFGHLCCQLKPCAAKWEDIAKALCFEIGEIANIRANPLKLMNAPGSFMDGVIEEWLRWAPNDARGSKSYPTLEALRAAVDKAGCSNIAFSLTLE